MPLKRTFLFVLFGFIGWCTSAQEDKHSRLDSLYQQSKSHNIKYDYKRSMETANELINLAREEDSYYYLAKGYNMIGLNNEMVYDTVAAVNHFKKSLEFAELAEDQKLISAAYNNLANVYSYAHKNDKKALKFYQLALQYAEEVADTTSMITPVMNIGWMYLDANKTEEAFQYLEKADRFIEKEGGDQETIIQIKYLLGEYFTQKKSYPKAEKYYKEAIATGSDTTELYQQRAMAYYGLSEMYRKTRQFEKSITNFKVYDSLIDLAYQIDKVKEITIASAHFMADEYKRELEATKAANTLSEEVAAKSRHFSFAAGFAVMILLIYLMAQYNHEKYRKRITEALEIKNQRLEQTTIEAKKLADIKTRFLSTVSHELRTPLYGIIGITNILLEDKKMNKSAKEYLTSLKFSGDYLIDLINDVLQLSKIESNKVVLQKNSFNIRWLIYNIKHAFEHQLRRKKNKLRIDIDETIPDNLLGDSVRLSQVIINLLGNAIKFTEKGTIQISLTADKITENRVRILFVLEDEGVGIPEEMQARIFESFTQLNREDGEYQGTGLGLSIVQKLIQLFGSEIKLESKEGEGSKFTFHLAFDIDHNVEKVEEDILAIDPKTDRKKRVLVVEDNKINQIVTQKILEKEGFEVTVVWNGEQAVEQVKNSEYEVVLMDLNMPKMDGFEASRRIRKFDVKTPIIALTAVEVSEVKDRIKVVGITDIVVKPYDEREFFQTIYKHMRNASIQPKVVQPKGTKKTTPRKLKP